ncbi:MAG: response regulator [Candidatus Omnitrophota bacterium]|nr:MAG: response regulator [Candidatus Omnitrophota bacterium]
MKKKILLIDDEKDLFLVMGKRIREWGYDLLGASNGKKGIDAVKTQNPDIVVLDYKMPDMDGIAVLKKIREINKTIPVIMFTAFPDERSIEGTEKLGVMAYIPKLKMSGSSTNALKSAISMAKKKLEDKNG